MKYRRLSIIIAGIMTIGAVVTGCGKNTTTTEKVTTEEVTTETVTTEEQTLSEMQEWIDTLYKYTLAGDWENVMKTAGTTKNLMVKCAEYEDKSWAMDFAPYEHAYPMTTSDGKHIGIVLYTFVETLGDKTDDINVFISENADRNYGFKYTGYNDTTCEYSVTADGQLTLKANCINNHLIRYDSNYEGDIEENEGINAWHA